MSSINALALVFLGALAGVVITVVVLRRQRQEFRQKEAESSLLNTSRDAVRPSVRTEQAVLAQLRQDLRRKVGYDEAIIDRLIDIERQRTPDASLRQLMGSAIERWERDNR